MVICIHKAVPIDYLVIIAESKLQMKPVSSDFIRVLSILALLDCMQGYVCISLRRTLIEGFRVCSMFS